MIGAGKQGSSGITFTLDSDSPGALTSPVGRATERTKACGMDSASATCALDFRNGVDLAEISARQSPDDGEAALPIHPSVTSFEA